MDTSSSASAPFTTECCTRRTFLQASGALAATVASSSLLPVTAFADETAQTITDMGGASVELPSPVDSYGDTWLSHASVDIMLDGAQGLVATAATREDDAWMYTVCPDMKNATSVCDPELDVAKLANQAPQFVFANGAAQRGELEEQNIPLVDCAFTSFDQMAESITLCAQILGERPRVNAEKYNDAFSKMLADIKAKTDDIAEADRPSVLFGASVFTGVVEGSGTIADEWMSAAGAVNANTGDSGTTDSPLAADDLAALDPDYIFTGTPSEVDAILGSKTWANTKAVKNKRVYANPAGVTLWGAPGVELYLQVPWAAACIHPDLFPDYDAAQATKGFYKDFYYYELDDTETELILAGEPPTAKTSTDNEAK